MKIKPFFSKTERWSLTDHVSRIMNMIWRGLHTARSQQSSSANFIVRHTAWYPLGSVMVKQISFCCNKPNFLLCWNCKHFVLHLHLRSSTPLKFVPVCVRWSGCHFLSYWLVCRPRSSSSHTVTCHLTFLILPAYFLKCFFLTVGLKTIKVNFSTLSLSKQLHSFKAAYFIMYHENGS